MSTIIEISLCDICEKHIPSQRKSWWQGKITRAYCTFEVKAVIGKGYLDQDGWDFYNREWRNLCEDCMKIIDKHRIELEKEVTARIGINKPKITIE